jgi:hypothetical protein
MKALTITSQEEWFKYAPPARGIKHWRNGRSAKELARAWFPDTGRPNFPPELKALLESNPATRNFHLSIALPELRSHFDRHGRPSNIDLLLVGSCNRKRTVVGIEAKADEPFSEHQIGAYRDAKKSKPKPSNVPARIDGICTALFGGTFEEKPRLRDLWYQLLSGLAGTLAEAKRRGATQCVFAVHQFNSSRLNRKKLAVSEEAYRRFVEALGLTGTSAKQLDATLVGPFTVHSPTDFLPSIPTFIGKCRRELDALLNTIDAHGGETLQAVKFLGQQESAMMRKGR